MYSFFLGGGCNIFACVIFVMVVCKGCDGAGAKYENGQHFLACLDQETALTSVLLDRIQFALNPQYQTLTTYKNDPVNGLTPQKIQNIEN